MTREGLYEQIQTKKSFLCVGLDTDISKIPTHLKERDDPVYSFNKAIIEATEDLCVAYKINTAFYETRGIKGWEAMEKTIRIIPDDCLSIVDAKRGDIGNTCHQYAKAFFGDMDADAITLSPYMGADSITPFLEYEDKWVIILALTSNASASDFQTPDLYKQVLQTAAFWGSVENTMFVVGATRAEQLSEVRAIVPDHFLLVPGVGAQGGSLEEVAANGMNDHCGLLVNSSRSIIYAGAGENFADKAREAAQALQQQMTGLLEG